MTEQQERFAQLGYAEGYNLRAALRAARGIPTEQPDRASPAPPAPSAPRDYPWPADEDD
jgi:hypothetical protein